MLQGNLDILVFGYDFFSDVYPGEEDPPNFLIKLLERFPCYEWTWVILLRWEALILSFSRLFIAAFSV